MSPFFQRREEWIGLADNHPDLFEKAKTYEKVDAGSDKRYTWVEGMTLDEVLEQREEIMAKASKKKKEEGMTWQEQLAATPEDDDEACLICTL